MADTLEIFGVEYTNVTGIIAKDDNGTDLTFTRGGGSPTLQTKTKTYTPTTSQQTESVSADSGYDGLSAVNVTVNAIPSQYIVPSGTLSVSDNGTTDCTNYANVTVNIPFVTYYTGSSAPSSSLGSNGDIYLKTV